MQQIILRADQQKLKNDIYTAWHAGNRNVLGVLPTGGGKSIIVSDIVLDYDRMNAQQAVIAHRTELVGQMSMHVARRGIKHRIIAPKQVISQIMAAHREEFNGQSFVNHSSNCSVVAVDTLNARNVELEEWASQQSLWTIDEAHHVLMGNKWGIAANMFKRALGLGVTASPARADRMGLGRATDGLFDFMCEGPSPRELMDLGAITDYEYVVPASDFQIDEDDFNKDGELSFKKGRLASQKSHIVGDVVLNYCKYAYGKQAIVFATDVETANEISQKFNEAGIPAASVSAKTKSTVRDDYVKRFKRGQLRVLVNVDLFGEGFDVPAVEVVIMARPTASLAVYLQQAGRALRSMQGKLFGLIIDHVNNYKRFGWPDRKRMWTLDRGEKRSKKERDPEEIELIPCRNCSRPYERVFPRCPHCGHMPEVQTISRSNIEMIDGDLMLLDREKLAELRKAIQLESPASVAQRVAHVAGHFAGKHAVDNQIERIQSQKRLSDNIAYWAGRERAKGRDDQQSYRRFYLTAGVDVLSALALPRVEMDALSEKVERWLQS